MEVTNVKSSSVFGNNECVEYEIRARLSSEPQHEIVLSFRGDLVNILHHFQMFGKTITFEEIPAIRHPHLDALIRAFFEYPHYQSHPHILIDFSLTMLDDAFPDLRANVDILVDSCRTQFLRDLPPQWFPPGDSQIHCRTVPVRPKYSHVLPHEYEIVLESPTAQVTFHQCPNLPTEIQARGISKRAVCEHVFPILKRQNLLAFGRCAYAVPVMHMNVSVDPVAAKNLIQTQALAQIASLTDEEVETAFDKKIIVFNLSNVGRECTARHAGHV